jgi:hypothetical protein
MRWQDRGLRDNYLMDSKMRVAYLCTEFPPRIYGGLGVYVDSISREMGRP